MYHDVLLSAGVALSISGRLLQVPITYVTEMSWVNELMKLAPTILLIAGYVWFTRKAMGGLGGMGGPGGSRGGMGGIFSVGKAPVCSLLPAAAH